MKFSVYSITGFAKLTCVAPAACAWSTLKSAAYVYADVGGSVPGIAALPTFPSVNSVARTCSGALSACRSPFGSCIEAPAVAPGGKRIVACRVPSASVTGFPRATWKAFEDGVIVVTCLSSFIRTAGSAST